MCIYILCNPYVAGLSCEVCLTFLRVLQSGLCSSSEVATSRGCIKIRHLTSTAQNEPQTARFPRMEECAHFHYEFAEIGPLQVDQR